MEPSVELLEGLREVVIPEGEEGVIAAGLKMMGGAARRNSHRLAEWREDLSVEYARLFIGPRNPPAVPFASFYLSESRALMTDDTIKVRKLYLDAGMAVKDLYRVPDDHVGIELEFVYYTTAKAVELLAQGDDVEASRLLEMRDELLTKHMQVWVPQFCDRVTEHTHEDFYKGAALVLKGCVERSGS